MNNSATTSGAVVSSPVRYDFSVQKLSNNLVRGIFWVTFVFFVLSTPTQWLTSWFGWENGDKIAEWMYNGFGCHPTRIFLEPWTIVTYMFMHGGLLHFGMNMVMLFVFYKYAREFFPNKTWLIVYFGSGVAAGLLFAALNQSAETVMVGASGGIMGLWGAAIVARIRYLRVPEDEQPWQCEMSLKKMLVFLVLQFATEFLIANVGHSAHLGGMLAGLAIGALLPLAQQPRVVASRIGFLVNKVEMVIVDGKSMVRSLEVTPDSAFNPERDFVAVENDTVDFRNRRSVSYEALLGTLPANVNADQLVFLASARQIGTATATEFHQQIATAEGEKLPDESGKLRFASYSVTAMTIVFLLLGQVTITPYLVYVGIAAVAATATMWYLIIGDLAGKLRRPYLFAGVILGAAALALSAAVGLAWLCGQTELVVQIIASIAIGHAIQRFVLTPLTITILTRGKTAA